MMLGDVLRAVGLGDVARALGRAATPSVPVPDVHWLLWERTSYPVGDDDDVRAELAAWVNSVCVCGHEHDGTGWADPWADDPEAVPVDRCAVRDCRCTSYRAHYR